MLIPKKIMEDNEVAVMKSIVILILNMFFSVLVFAGLLKILNTLSAFTEFSDESKIAAAVLLFIGVQTLYILIRIKIKKYNRFEVIYGILILATAVIILTGYTIKNRESVFSKEIEISDNVSEEERANRATMTVYNEVYFDKNMRVLKRVNNEYRYSTDYLYDSSGKILKESQNRINGDFISEINYSYKDNLLITKSENSGIGRYEERYSYDKNGNCIKMEKYNFDISETLPVFYRGSSYDKNNKKIEEKEYSYEKEKDRYINISTKKYEYSSDGKIGKVVEKRGSEELIVKEYSNNKVMFEKYYSKKRKMVAKNIYRYDEKNQIVSEEYYNKNMMYKKNQYKNIYE